MARYRHNSSISMWGIIIWIAVLFFAIDNIYFRVVLGLIAFVIFCIYIYSCYNEMKCPHGIYNGQVKVSGKCRCLECQNEYEHLIENKAKLIEEEKRQKEFEIACKEKYVESKKRARDEKIQGIKLSEDLLLRLGAYEFEDYVASILPSLGYQYVYQTPRSNDGGKDIICQTPNKERCFVECKRYEKEKSIGRPAIQKLGGAMAASNVLKGLFFATCSFSSTAIDEAKRLNIELFDLKKIEEIVLNKLPKEAQLETYTLYCPSCGEPVTFKHFHDKEAITCRNNHQVYGLWYDEQRISKWDKAHRYASKHGISID